VRLRPGDALLLDTKHGFRGAHESSQDFFVTNEAGREPEKTEEEARERQEEMWLHGGGWHLRLAVAVIVGVVAFVAAGVMHIALAGTLGIFVLVVAGGSRHVERARRPTGTCSLYRLRGITVQNAHFR
jgi:hypothetical protein